MSKQLSDEQRLQAFLRQHRPVPPPASPDLEAQLMKAITHSPQDTVSNQPKLAFAKPQKIIRRQLWLISSTIAAGILIVGSISHLLIPSPEVANANLEFFLETNWNEVIGDPGNNNLPTDWML